MENYQWYGTTDVSHQHYKCGYCSKDAAPSKGYLSMDGGGKNMGGYIYICPYCTQPTFMGRDGQQSPKPRIGGEIAGINNSNVAPLYREACDCTSIGSYTAAVMVCRKILMNLAVEHKANPNESFAYYVDFLDNKGYIPPQGKQWVDAIRKRGNDANHEIALMDKKDAQIILHFTEALLRINYELPYVLANNSK